MRCLYRTIALVTALITGCLQSAQAQEKVDLLRMTLTHGGVERIFFAHYPAIRSTTTPPLLIVLHGGGGADAETMSKRTGFNSIADREGFVVVYPAGIDGQWNDGRGKTFRRARDNSQVDDVGFIATLIDHFTKRGEIDRNRVYVMGMSNGGMMTHRLGIELGDRLAAIAPVIANLPVNLAAHKAVRPLPVLIMNGTDDPMMPWKGGPVHVFGKDYGDVLSTDETVRFWVRAAQLPTKATTEFLADRAPKDKCRVQRDSYRAPGYSAEVLLYRIQGGGHNFPGSNTPDRARLLGPKCMDINGPETIWEFLKHHVRNNTGMTNTTR